jgi:hypothetical protein
MGSLKEKVKNLKKQKSPLTRNDQKSYSLELGFRILENA